LIGGLIILVAALAACGPKTPAVTAAPTEAVATEAPVEVPFMDVWKGSGHANSTEEAFNHWNEDDPKVVPADCAKCHTSTGIVDFLNGAPVDVPVPGGVITCTTCHNATVMALSSVTFPSGAEITGLGPEARCMTCHQGRESKVSVDEAIAKVAEEADTVSADLGFKNIHYFAAAATLYGNEAHGGYEYDDKSYDAKHDHVTGVDTCLACHDQHSLQVRVEKCAVCHEVKDIEELKNVREPSSMMDYDGDGDTTEGMYFEIQGLQEALFAGIQAYGKEISGKSILFNADAHPYFFADANDNGAVDEGEGKYDAWTPRLLKAAYNYQVSIKDPGSFAHGNKYIVELLFDSLADLNTKLTTPIDMSKMHRDDAGHFAGNTEPFRHWDEEGRIVPASCAKCHSATGLPQFLKEGVNISNPASNGFQCSTCHDEANWPNRYAVASVTFPSGAVVSYGGKDADGKFVADDSNLCIACHQGRESTVSVNGSITGMDPDAANPKIRFKNVHYFAAGATLFGTEVKGAYEYDGKTYLGFNSAHPVNKCKDCHDVHKLEPKVETCAACHQGAEPEAIRAPGDAVDYDGDGNVTEGMYGEIETLSEALYAQILDYTKTKAGKGIIYDGLAYPYFFVDADGDSVADVGDKGPIGYDSWTPRLLKAAYNYQYSQKDPGAFVHNPKYVVQFLIDSIADLGGSVSAYTRP